MKKPVITKDSVKPLLETRFVKVFDLQYAEGRHYYDATRRGIDQLTAIKSDEEFRDMQPDAATVYAILLSEGCEPRLLLHYEYRYPIGQFMISPPAGLIDPEDRSAEEPLIVTARRELFEETGIKIKPKDRIFVVNPLVFSTPGMTDECNGLVCVVVNDFEESLLSQANCESTECFDGFCLVTKDEALKMLREGRDPRGNFYPAYTWMALSYFVSDEWKHV